MSDVFVSLKFPSERRHTLFFLEEARAVAPIYLDMTVDMTTAMSSLAGLRAKGRRCGVNSLLLYSISRAMAAKPEVNVAVRGRLRARQAAYSGVYAKFTLDKTINDKRVVCSAMIANAERMSLDEIQSQIDFHREADATTAPCFAGVRALHRMPTAVAYWIYRRVLSRWSSRARIHGSFALTSLGRHSISGFYPISGGTFTFGVGRIADAPIVRDGQIVIAPTLRICVTFDHRALDGAIVAEFLDDIKHRLERISPAGLS